MNNRPPGKGWLGWLGRQVGYVRKAVHTDPVPPPKVIHRKNHVEEKELPSQPGVKFRRTVIDEVIVDANKRITDSRANGGSEPPTTP
jgi:hypothetical protein